MHDRFTSEAKRTMNAARSEAVQLRHDHLRPEHIFLAICDRPEGLAAGVLRELGAIPHEVRADAERLLTPSVEVAGRALQFTASAKKVIELALSESEAMQHAVVGTGHLLVGLADLPESVSQRVLADRSITADLVRARVIEHGGLDAPGDDVLSESARRSQIAHQTLFVVVTNLENALRRVRDAIRRPF